MSRIGGKTISRAISILCAAIAIQLGAQAQRSPDNPTLRETLHWMQTSLESGAGDYWVGHEERSTRLEDFVGCKVHFSYSTHQEPYMDGEPAPEPKKLITWITSSASGTLTPLT